jgi:putative membrane protein
MEHGAFSSAVTAPALVAWTLLAAASVAYAMAARRAQRGRRGWSGWRIVSFVAGAVILAVAVSPPVAAWAHHDLRGHMTQHLLLGMIAPLGLVLAAPLTLVLREIPVPLARLATSALRSRPVRVATHPVTALLLDVGVLYLLFLTPLFAATLASPALHGVVHFHFFAAGSLFIWSIAGPDPVPHRPGFRTRLAALFVAIAAHSTLAKVMYAYGWPRGTDFPLHEVRAAAKLMYYGGDAAELLLAIALFAAWYRAAGRRRRSRSTARSATTAPPRPQLRLR